MSEMEIVEIRFRKPQRMMGDDEFARFLERTRIKDEEFSKKMEEFVELNRILSQWNLEFGHGTNRSEHAGQEKEEEE